MARTTINRSIEYMRQEGYYCQNVERYNSYTNRREDFGGFADIICWHPEKKITVAIQATVQKHAGAAERQLSEKASDHLMAWVKAENKCVIHAWAKRGPRGKRKVWTVNESDYLNKIA